MHMQQIINRSDIPKEDQWDLEPIYENWDAWETEYAIYENKDQKKRCPEFHQFQGRLGEGPATLKKALDSWLNAQRGLEKLYTYAHLKHDEDIANEEPKKAYARIISLIHDYQQEGAWFEPELLSLSGDQLQKYLASPLLSEYSFYLEKIFRMKPHTLSHDGEVLLALSGKALSTPHKAFSAINDADFHFGSVKDSEGNEKLITHASYSLYLRDQDRALRKNAFKKYLGNYLKYENTLCELLSGQIRTHIFQARARKYPSCLESALFSNNIPIAVYRSLLQAVNENLDKLHRYARLRKKVLKLNELHLYDMYIPLTPEFDIKMKYEEAENLVIESVHPLGNEYQSSLRKGLKKQRWVDRYENKNKRSGAYSSGCYDSSPYILMNYNESIRDLFTLAHEVGHSMHSLLSRESQPYHYASYPIFVAEVASTFNEELLMQHLLKQTKDKKKIAYLLHQKIEDIRTTLFRQAMFAELELHIHEMEERNQPVTPQYLKEIYLNLNQKYFGDSVIIDPEIEIEWARIPHFYYNFYVYQYATGISAALALSEIVLNGGNKEREAYLNFLKGGCHQYPIDLLKSAGVDMTDPKPVASAIRKFGELVDQLELAIKDNDC